MKSSKKKNSPKYISSVLVPPVAFLVNPNSSPIGRDLDLTDKSLLQSSNSSLPNSKSKTLGFNDVNNKENKTDSLNGIQSLDRGLNKKRNKEKIHFSKPGKGKEHSTSFKGSKKKSKDDKSKRNGQPNSETVEPKVEKLQIEDMPTNTDCSIEFPSQRLGLDTDRLSTSRMLSVTSNASATVEPTERNNFFNYPKITVISDSNHFSNNPKEYIETSGLCNEQYSPGDGVQVNPPIGFRNEPTVTNNEYLAGNDVYSMPQGNGENAAIVGMSQPSYPNVSPPYPIENKGSSDLNIQQPNNESIELNFPRNEKANNPDVAKRLLSQQEEISTLRDTVYRLNVELENALQKAEYGIDYGCLIGESVLPGKGPVPEWLMNTRYLAPLLAAHDLKFRKQHENINHLQSEIIRFENEIRQVLTENQRLHMKLQENQKGGRAANHSEWQVIANQAKLLIEENRLLLEELDVHQQKAQVMEREHIMMVSGLKKEVSTVRAERDALNEEIENLTKRLIELKSFSEQQKRENMENMKNEEEKLKLDRIKREMESKINDMDLEIKKLKDDLLLAKEREMKVDRVLQHRKKETKLEDELRDYVSQIVDKNYELAEKKQDANERLKQLELNIRKTANRIIGEIKHRTTLELYEQPNQTRNNTAKLSTDHLYAIRNWFDLLIDEYEDVIRRCRQQEKNVVYYQSLLKEKEKAIDDFSRENREMECRLDDLIKSAAN